MNTKYKIQQGYHDIYTLGLLIVFTLISVVKLGDLILNGKVLSWETLLIFCIIGLFAYLMYLVKISKLKLKIGTKNISIKIDPFGWTRMKFSTKEVKSFKFFNADPFTIASGHFVHFGGGHKVFNFGDSCGIALELYSGKKVIIFSNLICEQKSDIERILTGN